MQPPLDKVPDIPHVRRRLPNGLEVVAIPNHEVPLVRCRLGFRVGVASGARAGTALMTMALLPRKLSKELGREGLDLQEFSSRDGVGLGVSCLPDQLADVLRMLATLALQPEHDAKGLDVTRESWLRRGAPSAGSVAEMEFRRQLFGDHPYGCPPKGRADALRELRSSDVAAWWARFGRPDNAVLYVAGDVSPEEAIRLAEEHFGAWSAEGPAPVPEPPPPPNGGERRIVLVDRPGSAQSEIRIGHLSVTPSHEDWHAAQILGLVLAGGPTSRLNVTLRQDEGLTYAARGGFDAGRDAGALGIAVSTRTPRTAEVVRRALTTVARLGEEGPTSEELETARGLCAGSLAGSWETADAVASYLWHLDVGGLGPSYVHDALAAYGRLTPAALQRAARRLIEPERLVIVVVGDASQVRAGLEEIAPVSVRGGAAEATGG